MAKPRKGRPTPPVPPTQVESQGLEPEYLPFEVLSEPWSRFRLEDGTNLRVRFILLKMLRAPGETPAGLKSASLSSQITVAVEPPAGLRGPPAPVPSPTEISQHIERDVAFESLDVAPSVYRFEKDRTLVVTTNLVRVRRTTLFGPDGDRIYQVETGSQVIVMGGPALAPPVTVPQT